MPRITLTSAFTTGLLLFGTASAAPSTLAARSKKEIDFCGISLQMYYPSPSDIGRRDDLRDARKFYSSDTDVSNWNIVYFDGSGLAGAKYETEHIMEAQTVSKFLRRHCAELGDKAHDIGAAAFGQLGSWDAPDRLVLLEKSLNQIKARVFGDKSVATDRNVDNSSPGEQIMFAQDVALVFDYMSQDLVWNRFCDTYFAVFDALVGALANSGLDQNVQENIINDYPTYVHDTFTTFNEDANEFMGRLKDERHRNTDYEQIWNDHANDAPFRANAVGCIRNGHGNLQQA